MLLKLYKNKLEDIEIEYIKENANIITIINCCQYLLHMINDRYADHLGCKFNEYEYDKIAPPTTFLHLYYQPIICLIVYDEDIELIIEKPTHVDLKPTKIRLEKNHYYIIQNIFCFSFVLKPNQSNDRKPILFLFRIKIS